MNKLFYKVATLSVGLAMAIGVGVGLGAKAPKSVKAADSGLTPTNGTFIIDFYDSEKLSSTSGTGLTNNNYSNFVKVYTGLTATDVVTGVSVTGTVQYGKNGGLTAGTGTAAGDSSNYVTFNIGSDYAVTKCTVYATQYESGRWKLNGNASDSGSLGSKGATFSTVTSPLIWDNLSNLTSLTFKKDNGSGGNQKRLTIYTIVCEYSVEDTPSVSITAPSYLVDGGSSGTLTGTITNDDSYTITWTASPSTGVTFSPSSTSSSGDNVTVSFSGTTSGTTPIVITATLDDGDSTSSSVNVYSLGHAGTSADPFTATDAMVFSHTNYAAQSSGDWYVKGYVVGTYQSKGYYIDEDKTATSSPYKFEVFNNGGLPSSVGGKSIVVGTSIITAHGSMTCYNNSQCEITGATITDVDNGATPGVSIDQGDQSIYYGDALTFTATTENAGAATVTWSSSDESVATIGASTGVVTTVGAGTTTITATITVDAHDYTDEVLLTVTVPMLMTGDTVIFYYDTFYLTDINTGGSNHYGNKVDTEADAYVYTVGAGTAEGSYTFSNGGNYLIWNSGNTLDYSNSVTANSSWTVTGASLTSCLITNVGDTTRTLRYNTGSPRFACYQGTQQVVSIKKVTVLDVESIEISGNISKTSYEVGESWDPSGLTVTATYTDESTGDVTSLVTWSYSPTTPSAMGAGTDTLTITATYSGKTDDTTETVTVTVPSYDNVTNLVPGDYYIAYNDSGTKHYISAVSDGKGATVTDKNSALVFTFALVGNDTWEITNNGNYLGVGNGSTTLTLNSTQTTLTITWENETNITRKITGSSERDLAWYASNSDIRTYSGKTDGTNGMTLESAKTVSSFTVDDTSANKNVLKDSTFDAAAAAAAGFVAKLNYTDSTYDDVTSLATWSLDTSVAGTATLTVSYLSYTPVSINDMNIYTVTLVSLSIDASSAKTTGYTVGDPLDTTGLVIVGHDSLDNNYPLSVGDVSFSPTTLNVAGTQVITVTYTNDDSSTAVGTYSVSVAAFVGYTKVTSLSDLTPGDSYVLGVENINHAYDLMGPAKDETATAFRNKVDATAAFNEAKTTVTQSGAATAGAVVITLLSDGNGKYAFYDVTNDKYLAGSSSNYFINKTSLSDAGDNAWWTISFADGLMSVTLNNSTRVLGYNLGSPRFSTYASYAANSTTVTSGTAHPVLFKMSGSSVKTSVTSFANDSLKMNDPAYEGDITTPNCASNYAAMKIAYVALSDAEKNVFQYSSDYSAARARLEKWAKANGETFTYGAETPFAASAFNPLVAVINEKNSSTAIIIIVVSILAVTSVGGYFFLRRKKEQ